MIGGYAAELAVKVCHASISLYDNQRPPHNVTIIMDDASDDVNDDSNMIATATVMMMMMMMMMTTTIPIRISVKASAPTFKR